MPQWLKMVLSVLKKCILFFFGDFLSGRTSKLHHWFESCVDFGELVDFYYLKLVGGGAVINKAYPV